MNGIKKQRLALGFTQSQLAIMVGVGQSIVAQWETGRALPRADKLPEIAKALGCSIDELYADAGKAG
ncbi:MAG: helix-turn-helix transcriptional regulator [Oscillospiraceae bacterium]